MGLWKRGRRYWTQTVVNGVWIRRPLCPEGSTHATTSWQEAVRLEKELIRSALQGNLPSQSHSIKLFAAIDDYLAAKKATANTQRAIEFDRERLEAVKRVLGDVKLSAITARTIEGFQAKRRLEGKSNRTVNMDIGALRQVMKRFKQWRRLEDDVKMLTESGGEPIGRVLTNEEQERLLKMAEGNPEWEHVWCAAQLAANTSMRGVEVKNVRRKDFDPRKSVVHIRTSKNETSKRVIPLNDSAREAVQRMVTRADLLGHTDPNHYLWCANQHHKLDPTKPASKWDTAWRALRDAAGLPGLRFHDLRHTVVTRLLEAGEPDHVVESITGHLSRRMLEHYSHIRLNAKKAALDRLDDSGKAAPIKITK
jgi:integrase